jgi:hypothetical protein
MVEITNENSFSKLGPGIAAGLPEPYRKEFQRQWNKWLANRYQTTVALKKSWAGKNEPLGTPLADSSSWDKTLGGWRVRQSSEYPVTAHFDQPGPPSGVATVKLQVDGEAPEVHLQEFQFPDLRMEAGKIYTLSFWIKAEASRTVYVDVSIQGPPIACC